MLGCDITNHEYLKPADIIQIQRKKRERMPLYFLHFITDGKWVLKMSQGAPMDEIISNACVVLNTSELQDLGIYMYPA